MSTEISNDQTATNASCPRVTVVIPAYNEGESVNQLAECLTELKLQAASDYELNFVVVDDASNDDTLSCLEQTFSSWQNFEVIKHEENQGVAAAIMTGIRHAETSLVASMDFDCTYQPIELLNLLPMIEHADIVTASPYHPDGQVKNVPEWRLVFSRGASWAYRRVMTNKLHTYTSCFRVYRRSSVSDLELRNGGFVGVAEMLWRVSRRKGKIVEVPATLDVRKFGQSKMRLAQVTFGHLRLLGRALSYRLCRRFLPSNVTANPRYPAISSGRSANA